MKTEALGWRFVVVGLVVGALYFVAFFGIEGCRRAKGPWEVTFSTNDAGAAVSIRQPRMKLHSIIRFPGESVVATNVLPQTVAFDRPKKAAPFGKVIYEDLMQLPGVITFDMFGHEIELLPRALIVNKRAIPWGSQGSVELRPEDKPAQPPKPRPSWK